MSNGNFAQTHLLCLPKDLSIVNRRGYASTTRKGVPLIFRVGLTVYPSGLDGSGYVTSVSSDVKTTVKALGAPNNWVMRNAAVKFHAAQRAAWKKAGVRMKDLGAYAKEIRYNWVGASTSWADPVDGAGAAYAGGTWDATTLYTESDANGFALKLTGAGINETSANTTDALNIAHSYLMSRATVPADSNLESSDIPAEFSVLNELLRPGQTSGADDNIIVDVQGQGDNPPYDLYTAGNTNGDITEPVELGRVTLLPQGSGATAPQTMMLDIPFGICEIQMAHRDPDDNSGVTDDLAIGVEVLDIFEMQG